MASGVVLLDVEFDEGAEPRDRVQGVEVEPRDGGAWNSDLPRKGSGAGVDDMLAQAVVIGAPPARGGGGDGGHRGENHPARVSLQKT